eukprot:TRINITY_DN10044_c0_g1_i1.p1 TRINITY_DN10044_c0_g1~~TRINITY_DN10044_c0_g1_i1.p1  ORF type:complete len:348 (+),score=7.46 TRINITY_DN10044_c0_g1_i1:218-1261(+)
MTWLIDWLGSLSLSQLLGTVTGSVVLLWFTGLVVSRMIKLNAGIRGVEREPLFMADPNSDGKVPIASVYAPATKYFTVVYPAYNEAERLPGTMDETLRYLQERAKKDRQFTYEVLVVDDGSSDGTVDAAFAFGKVFGGDAVRVVRQGVNQGKGAAVRKGAMCARGELILFADADGATRFPELEKLEAQVLRLTKMGSPGQSPPDSCPGVGDVPAVAFGSRAHLEKKALVTRKWYRNVLMYGFYFAVMLATGGTGVRDTQCGFKMFTRAAARKLFRNQRLNRWTFDVELLYLCKKLHIPVAEVSVAWTEIPGSKLRPSSIVHMLYELALIRIGYGLRLWTIKRDTVPG